MPTQKNPQNRVEAAQPSPPAEPNATEYSATEHSAIDSTHRVVNVCAVAIRNRDGLVLTVRKRGSDGFMMPGGKPEPGETPLQTACR
ncbi:MAG: NUDIX domain-containing protein, partial [Rothia mucilaginosa]|nr:NUDIX domain-containing protein [Rothia mucilaginosa]